MADSNLSSFIGPSPICWQLQAAEYGKVILPFTVLRRLDCVLEPTKAAISRRRRSVRTPA
jgi:type I restriction enzyme M protein